MIRTITLTILLALTLTATAQVTADFIARTYANEADAIIHPCPPQVASHFDDPTCIERFGSSENTRSRVQRFIDSYTDLRWVTAWEFTPVSGAPWYYRAFVMDGPPERLFIVATWEHESYRSLLFFHEHDLDNE